MLYQIGFVYNPIPVPNVYGRIPHHHSRFHHRPGQIPVAMVFCCGFHHESVEGPRRPWWPLYRCEPDLRSAEYDSIQANRSCRKEYYHTAFSTMILMKDGSIWYGVLKAQHRSAGIDYQEVSDP